MAGHIHQIKLNLKPLTASLAFGIQWILSTDTPIEELLLASLSYIRCPEDIILSKK